MSTIAYRAGVMAADTRAYSGSKVPIGNKVKIWRIEGGALIGVATAKPGQGEMFVQWVRDGADPHNAPTSAPDFEALLVRPNGEALFFYDSFLPSGPLIAPYFAIGSGSQYALGALAVGAGAEAAVAAAVELDQFTGGLVTRLEHFEPLPDEPECRTGDDWSDPDSDASHEIGANPAFDPVPADAGS
ncbi:hypothetical protein [Ancylobacter rudongensis]|uniref:ATP-dependent HslUV protease, peptidase subunit HslV n=1 Tax=Ancylobacter rudongensis TaxID=177413 RepID=A0A1G4UPG6_9HYPH|nr:hypothetical protein [Ancylobacter rudongensis]SCW95543.1 ATP-dependent HslUV protease, peptidase subunit HslV [Ancylobacter rudongensis]